MRKKGNEERRKSRIEMGKRRNQGYKGRGEIKIRNEKERKSRI